MLMPIKQCAPPKKEGYIIVAVIFIGFLLTYGTQKISNEVMKSSTNENEWKCTFVGPLVYAIQGKDTVQLQKDCVTAQVKEAAEATTVTTAEGAVAHADALKGASADADAARKKNAIVEGQTFTGFVGVGLLVEAINQAISNSFSSVQNILNKNIAAGDIIMKIAEGNIQMVEKFVKGTMMGFFSAFS